MTGAAPFPQSTFEEVVYLLWYGALPTKKEYDAFYKSLTSTATRKLPPKLMALLRALRAGILLEQFAHRHLRVERLGLRPGDVAQDIARRRGSSPEIAAIR